MNTLQKRQEDISGFTKIKCAIFDFDGTLIDTNELIFNSYRKAFKEVLNKDIEMEEILTLYGKPLYPSLGIYKEAQEDLYQVYRKYNADNHDILAKPFDGVYEGISLLKKKGYNHYEISNFSIAVLNILTFIFFIICIKYNKILPRSYIIYIWFIYDIFISC